MRYALAIPALVLGLIISLIVDGISIGTSTRFVKGVQEMVTFATFPSADNAYEYGNRHFDAREAGVYDVDRAEYFFEEALLLDPRLPYVRHQLARIAFLRGDFREALRLIDEEIAMPGGPASASSHYIRGLILGYAGAYAESARSYERFLATHPDNWAAINDYAWVLLKDGRSREAMNATARGLSLFPDNPWLLNSNAIALHELGLDDVARMQVARAVGAAHAVSEEDWLIAYPGNDPAVAGEGIVALQEAIRRNMHTIILASLSDTHVQ